MQWTDVIFQRCLLIKLDVVNNQQKNRLQGGFRKGGLIGGGGFPPHPDLNHQFPSTTCALPCPAAEPQGAQQMLTNLFLTRSSFIIAPLFLAHCTARQLGASTTATNTTDVGSYSTLLHPALDLLPVIASFRLPILSATTIALLAAPVILRSAGPCSVVVCICLSSQSRWTLLEPGGQPPSQTASKVSQVLSPAPLLYLQLEMESKRPSTTSRLRGLFFILGSRVLMTPPRGRALSNAASIGQAGELCCAGASRLLTTCVEDSALYAQGNQLGPVVSELF